MESNGLPNKIQVSQTTADALIARGRGAWLTPREEKVKAKGAFMFVWLSMLTDTFKFEVNICAYPLNPSFREGRTADLLGQLFCKGRIGPFWTFYDVWWRYFVPNGTDI